MKKNTVKLLIVLVLIFNNVIAQYTEKIKLDGYRVNMVHDFNLVNDDGNTQQGNKLNLAINHVTGYQDLNGNKGGIIYIPKGTYMFNDVQLKSNVHILVEPGTVFKVEKNGFTSNKGVVKSVLPFNFSHVEYDEKGRVVSVSDKYIENVSLRGDGGAFTVDMYNFKIGDKIRFVVAKMVKNFLIENIIIRDNNSTHSAFTFTPINTETNEEVASWEVTRPTFGTLKNISHYRCSPDYALVQCHGAQNIQFENLYANGGVTFRLEVGADNINVGVYDVFAKNIIGENGKSVALLGPHSAKNGEVHIDGITSIGSSRVISFGDGHVKENSPIRTPGYFSSNSTVKNIHAIYGNNGQFKWDTAILNFEESDFDNLKKLEGTKHYTGGPTIGIVKNKAKSYSINIDENTITRGDNFPESIPNILEIKEDTKEEKTLASNKNKEWENNHMGTQYISHIGTHITPEEEYLVEAYDFKSTKYYSESLSSSKIDFTNKLNVSLLSNPVSNFANLVVKDSNIKEVKVSLFSSLGKGKINNLEVKVNKGIAKVNLDNIVSGIYYLSLKNFKNKSKSKLLKVVVVK